MLEVHCLTGEWLYVYNNSHQGAVKFELSGAGTRHLYMKMTNYNEWCSPRSQLGDLPMPRFGSNRGPAAKRSGACEMTAENGRFGGCFRHPFHQSLTCAPGRFNIFFGFSPPAKSCLCIRLFAMLTFGVSIVPAPYVRLSGPWSQNLSQTTSMNPHY